jgi:hypothetical protein
MDDTKSNVEMHELRPDVVSYFSDYKLEGASFVLSPDRLRYWQEHFHSIPQTEKQDVATELVAKLIALKREVQRILDGNTAPLEEILQNTFGIVAWLLIGDLANGADIFRSLGDAVIQTESNAVVVRGGEIEEDGKAIPKDLPSLSPERAFDRLEKESSFNLQQIQSNMSQARTESRKMFRLMMVSAAVGFAVIIVGIGVMLVGSVPAGAVTSAAGTIPEALAAIFFKKDRELRADIITYDSKTRDMQKFLTSVTLSQTVDDPQTRNALKSKIIEAMLRPS